MGLFFVFLCQKDNNSMQRTPLRGAADAERWVEWKRTVLLHETKVLRQPVPIDRP